LVKEAIYLDKKLNFKEVHVLNENNNTEIKMVFTKIDMKATFNNKYFTVNENMATAIIDNTTQVVTKIEDIIYPMYIPANTHLTSQDTVEKTSGQRIILTFEGDKPFVLVEETANKEDSFTIIPTYGDPIQLTDTVGYVSENTVSWISNGIEYYLASDVINQDELLQVAESISAIPVGK
jgi:hypothetical protein